MKTQSKLMALLSALLLFTAVIWRISSLPDFQLFGDVVSRVETAEQVVALTFDDGPQPGKTEQILAILQQANIPATFFLIGKEIEAHPELLKKIIAAGHQVGNHSYSHQRMVFRSVGFMADEVERTDALLRAHQVQGDLYFRPPYGKKLLMLPWYLQKNNRISLTWDVAPEDFAELAKDQQKLVDYTVRQTKPGSIILLHVMYDSRATTMAAVPDIISGLKARGFRFVTVVQLLTLRNQH